MFRIITSACSQTGKFLISSRVIYTDAQDSYASGTLINPIAEGNRSIRKRKRFISYLFRNASGRNPAFHQDLGYMHSSYRAPAGYVKHIFRSGLPLFQVVHDLYTPRRLVNQFFSLSSGASFRRSKITEYGSPVFLLGSPSPARLQTIARRPLPPVARIMCHDRLWHRQKPAGNACFTSCRGQIPSLRGMTYRHISFFFFVLSVNMALTNLRIRSGAAVVQFHCFVYGHLWRCHRGR